VIAIYALRDDDEARAIRAALRREKLPAILVGPENGFCDVCGRLPFVLLRKAGGASAAALPAVLHRGSCSPVRRTFRCPRCCAHSC